MKRLILVAILAGLASTTAAAHFLWVVPDLPGRAATVIISETLIPDVRVDAATVRGATLSWRDASGRETPLAMSRGDRAFTVPLAATSGLVHGHADLGVRESGERFYRLHYYPKAVVGNPFARPAVAGNVPIEIVPTGMPGAVRLQVLVAGTPRPGVDVTVVLPDGTQTTVQTDAAGLTEQLGQRGQYGAWARHWEATPGQHDGKKYDQVRHYATLVFEVGNRGATTGLSTPPAVAARLASLPEAASSFGAVASDGWLYVYGGHVVPTHRYSTDAVSGRFNRLNLSDGHTWEPLAGGPALQGMNLAAHAGKVYRVGGMQPQNKPNEEQNIRSVAEVARFDPAVGRWDSLPSLPAPRSSHDVVVVGNSLIVVGGWTLKGAEKTQWPATIEVMDLAAATPAWRSLPQPFTRRAHVAAVLDGKVYVIGGFDERSQVVRAVSVYDVQRGTWSSGPDLPGGAMSGFGPAAATLGGRLYVSIDDGGLHRLNAAGNAWELVGRATPRIVHRLVPRGTQMLVLGGAAGGGNSDLIESIAVDLTTAMTEYGARQHIRGPLQWQRRWCARRGHPALARPSSRGRHGVGHDRSRQTREGMAVRNTGPRLHLGGVPGAHRPGPPVTTIDPRPHPPAQSVRSRRRPSLFAQRLMAAQRLRCHYGVTERELRGLVTVAARANVDAGLALVQLLERRVDSVVFRAGFARSVPAARQLVAHGHIAVNGRVLDVPSTRLLRGEVLAVRPRARDAVRLQQAGGAAVASPAWLEVDDAELTVRLTSLPDAQAIPVSVEIGLVLEFYSWGSALKERRRHDSC